MKILDGEHFSMIAVSWSVFHYSLIQPLSLTLNLKKKICFIYFIFIHAVGQKLEVVKDNIELAPGGLST